MVSIGKRSMAKKQEGKEIEIKGIRRGEIYLVNFDPTVGSEIRKTRPALVIQNDIANVYSSIVIVAALTSHYDFPLYPTEVLIRKTESGLAEDSVVLLNQIRSVDKKRLVRRLGVSTAETMHRVDRAVEISLGLIKI